MNIFSNAALPEIAFGLPFPILCAFVAMLGAILGSFLNVVIHRLPREESIVFPNSRCPSCGAAIKAYDNIPVISYLVLRGRCRNCGVSISARYPAVEALTALLYALVFWKDGLSVLLPFDLVFVTALVALVFIDAEHMILPNAITYPGIIFALVARVVIAIIIGPTAFDDLPQLMSTSLGTHPLWTVSLVGAVLGALVGGGSLWLMGYVWEKLRGVEAMGLGDVKMMFMVGAYLGWRLAVLIIFLGVFSGSITGVMLMLRRGERNMQMLLPFGIFLGASSVVALLIGARIVNWYALQFVP